MTPRTVTIFGVVFRDVRNGDLFARITVKEDGKADWINTRQQPCVVEAIAYLTFTMDLIASFCRAEGCTVTSITPPEVPQAADVADN